MRLIKMLGLAVVAAVVAMAFVGASSALANGPTSLCTVDEEPCEKMNEPLNLHFEGHPTFLISTPKLTILCGAVITGDSLKLGNPLVVHNVLITYTLCTPAGCEANQVSGHGLLDILSTASKLGTVSVSAGSTIEWLGKCGKTIHCVYNWEGLTGHALSAGTAGVALNGAISFSEAAITKVSGFACPEPIKLNGEFIPLEKLYVTE